MNKDGRGLVSVIVPVYNVSAYLDRCLQTIVTQTYEDLEILLIDDGSQDDSGAKCDDWSEKDCRIKVIHQENSGLSCARNTGLDAASGEYILFVDSDDFLSPDLCGVLLDAMTPDVNITVCDCVHVFPNQEHSFEISSDVQILSAEAAIQQMWYQVSFLPSAWAKLFRRSVFREHRFTPGILFEDVDVMHELFWTAERIAYTPSGLYGYVHRENSLTTKPFSAREFDILQIARKILQFAQDKPALMGASQAYAVTAAFRIYLNAPKVPEFVEGISQAETMIECYGKVVLRDREIRRKNRYALYLYFLCRPLLRYIYQYIDRWKS